MPEFSRCLIEKMLTYALGRGTGSPTTGAPWTEINRKLAADGYRFQTLIYEIVHSLPFQMRRGELVESTERRKKEIAPQ